ncbi:MAG: hypothetical protein ACYDES_08170 [Acidimicrobiales bacterium]
MRRTYLHRRIAAGSALVLAVVGLVIAASTLVHSIASGSGTAPAVVTARRPPATTTTVPATTTTVPPTTTTTVNPGNLPQTAVLPTATDSVFTANMAALWQGIVTDSLQAAMPAFFPEAAYVQLKSVGNPAADFSQRLVTEYGQDLAAAHALLGSDPSAATLVGVNVDEAYAHWVPPSACYNSIGYYEVPNARVVYTLGGQTESFGIASMISWRGEWYVVHLGAVLRSGYGGVVDSPQTGPGVSAYSPTC